MKIRLSKAQWQSIGTNARWMKQAKTDEEYAIDAAAEAVANPNMVFDIASASWVDMSAMNRIELTKLSEEGDFSQRDQNKIRNKLYPSIASNQMQTKTAQHLDNVKTLEKLTNRELCRALRDAIIAEEDAIKQYETVVDSTDNDIAKETLQEIANEEKVHVGELQQLLNQFLRDEKDFLEEGSKEVTDKK